MEKKASLLGLLLFCGFIATLVDAQQASTIMEATCTISSRSGDETYPISGTLRLIQEETGPVRITGLLSGFDTTDGYSSHGFHVHELGVLSNGCKDAKGHYNPFDTDHGAPANDINNRHVGDLGNINEDGSSDIVVDITDSIISLHGKDNIIGRSIVVHEKADDFGLDKDDEGSITTGNAGSRLACCEIIGVAYVNSGSHSTTTYNLSMLIALVCFFVLFRT